MLESCISPGTDTNIHVHSATSTGNRVIEARLINALTDLSILTWHTYTFRTKCDLLLWNLNCSVRILKLWSVIKTGNKVTALHSHKMNQLPSMSWTKFLSNTKPTSCKVVQNKWAAPIVVNTHSLTITHVHIILWFYIQNYTFWSLHSKTLCNEPKTSTCWLK
jgi:hypothetical protein